MVETMDESIEICAINYCCIFYHTNTKIHNYKTSYITVENKCLLSKVALHNNSKIWPRRWIFENMRCIVYQQYRTDT